MDVTLIRSDLVNFVWSDPVDNGGATINGRRSGWSLSPSGEPTNAIPSDRADTITGLKRATTYYFRASVRNVIGWGPWSGAVAATTLPEVPGTPESPVFSQIKQTTAVATFLDSTDNGGRPVLERQVGYSLVNAVPFNPQGTIPIDGPTTITGMLPGRLYWFASRTRNTVGWSEWSPKVAVRTVAGAFVKVSGVWRPAVPYVRVNGVWRVARPWGRLFGFWEESA